MDNKTHPVGEVVQLTMEKLREMVDVNTVVGDPIHTPEGVTVIPVSKVSIGLVSGGSDFTTKNQPAGSNSYGGASSAGVNMRLLPVAPTEAGALDKAIDLLPELLTKVSRLLDQRKATKAEKKAAKADTETTEGEA